MGTFEATEVTVSAEAAGPITSLDVEEGDTVTANATVGCIDTVQLHLQKLQLMKQSASNRSTTPDISAQAASLRQQIAHQQYERDRISNLLKDGAATQKQYDDANASIRILKGQLSALMSTLGNNTRAIDESSSAIDLQIAAVEDRIAHCKVSSPISGTVLAKYAEQGEYAAPGHPLFKVADLNRIYLRAYFTSPQLADISLGREVTVRATYGDNHNQDYKGRITWIASESEFTPKNIQTDDTRANLVYAVKISVVNDGKLKIGMSAEVIL